MYTKYCKVYFTSIEMLFTPKKLELIDFQIDSIEQ